MDNRFRFIFCDKCLWQGCYKTTYNTYASWRRVALKMIGVADIKKSQSYNKRQVFCLAKVLSFNIDISMINDVTKLHCHGAFSEELNTMRGC